MTQPPQQPQGQPYAQPPQGQPYAPPLPNGQPAAGATQPPQPPAKKGKNRTGCLVLVALAILLLVLINSCQGGSKKADAPSTTAPAAAATTAATPAAPADPQAKLDKAVRDALGSSNRDGVQRVSSVEFVDGVAKVKFAFNDNLSEKMVKAGARMDTAKVIKAVKSTVGDVETHVTGTFAMQDKYGNASEDEVVFAVYNADTIAKIQPDTIDPDQVWQVADTKSVVPAFQGAS